MNRVAIRRDGREERIMYSVDEGIMEMAIKRAARKAADHKKGYGGDDDDDDDDSEEGAQKRWPQNNGQNCFIQCRRRRARQKLHTLNLCSCIFAMGGAE